MTESDNPNDKAEAKKTSVAKSSSKAAVKSRPALEQRMSKAADKLDEKFSDVTPRQKELVHAMLLDGLTPSAAANAIGADRGWAYTVMQKDSVQEYQMALARAALGGLALKALSTAENLLDARSERIRLDAAVDLLNRAGIGVSGDKAPAVTVNIKT